MSNLRIRVAYAIGMKLVEQGDCGDVTAVMPWSDISASAQSVLLELADAALAEVERDVDGKGGLIPESDLRHILDLNRDSADIVWGAGGYVEGLSFTDNVTIAGNGDEPRDYRAGLTYWRVGVLPKATLAA